MLFNSHLFIFVFLPLFYLLYLVIRIFDFKFKQNLFLGLIILFSLFFYAYWDYNYLFIIIASVIINFISIRYIIKKNIFILTLVIFFNIGLLFYYKYFDVLIGFVTNNDVNFNQIIIPLGISFFTFQQIGYLIELYYDKKKKLNFLKYFAFVIFFPQLIAGPILKSQEFFPKFYDSFKDKKLLRNLLIGLIIFFIGLSKKVLIADNLSVYVNNYYNIAAISENLNLYESWLASIGYLFQLYFDFSGYSDMAVGIAKIFGLNLPWNFNSPLKKISIQHFWNCWHITLTRFTTSYIFTPIIILFNKYNLNFRISILFAVIVTFTLIGVWHGAGINFLIFGILHATAYLVNKSYSFIVSELKLKFLQAKIFNYLYWLITFLFVCFSFVFFRSENLQVAKNIAFNMLNFKSLTFPAFFFNNKYILEFLGFFNAIKIETYIFQNHNFISIIFISFLIIILFPNTKRIAEFIDKCFYIEKPKEIIKILILYIFLFFLSFLIIASILSLNNEVVFLYYQF